SGAPKCARFTRCSNLARRPHEHGVLDHRLCGPRPTRVAVLRHHRALPGGPMTALALKRAPTPAPPCVAYTRVSTEEQATPDNPSLAQQRNAILGLAQRLKV